jgi:acyl carrier protein
VDTDKSAPHDGLLASLTHFVNTALLDDPRADVAPHTPLLEWGVLNSLNIARLLAYLRETHGVAIPAEEIVGRNFKDLDSIVAMVTRVRDGAGDPAEGAKR